MNSFKFFTPWKGFGKSGAKEDVGGSSRSLSKIKGKPQLLATKTKLNSNENIFVQQRRHSTCIGNNEWESNYTSKLTPIVPLHSGGKENIAVLKLETSKLDAFDSRQSSRQLPSNLSGKFNNSSMTSISKIKEEDVYIDNLVEARNNAIQFRRRVQNLNLCKTVNVNSSSSSSTSFAEQRPVPFPRKPGIFYQFGEQNDQGGKIEDNFVIIAPIANPRKCLTDVENNHNGFSK
ncbi:unnamed protein product [Orchesella dallaii]|uniref:Uncharacterized protein n=1 Tax=Orchesella dallaii TaxID=48710 RepID=A0ABP1RIY7_9HEXA